MARACKIKLGEKKPRLPRPRRKPLDNRQRPKLARLEAEGHAAFFYRDQSRLTIEQRAGTAARLREQADSVNVIAKTLELETLYLKNRGYFDLDGQARPELHDQFFDPKGCLKRNPGEAAPAPIADEDEPEPDAPNPIITDEDIAF
jgi:hypothetical protein